MFQPFDGNVQTHSSTIYGRQIPGRFSVFTTTTVKSQKSSQQQQLQTYLTGVRLTSTYHEDKEDLYLTVMGYMGDAVWFAPQRTQYCQGSEDFLKKEDVEQNLHVYAQTAPSSESSNSISNNNDACSGPIRLYNIPMRTHDHKVNVLPSIFHGDVTSCLRKTDIVQASRMIDDEKSHDDKKQHYKEMAIQVKIWMILSTSKGEDSASNYVRQIVMQRPPALAVNIPLSTGVVGIAGPQIRNKPAPPPITAASSSSRSPVHPTALVPSYIGAPPIGAMYVLGYMDRTLRHASPNLYFTIKILGLNRLSSVFMKSHC